MIEGGTLLAEAGCLNCHVFQGAGAENLGAPDLTAEGLKGRGVVWQIGHLQVPGDLSAGSLMPSFATLRDEQLLQLPVFLDAAGGREPRLVDGEQGRRTLELISAIYQAGHLGGVVKLPLPPDAPFYTREGILRNARHFHEKTKSVENFSDDGITLGRDLGK